MNHQNFKIGDEVVVIHSDWKIPVGTVLIIKELDEDGVSNTSTETSTVDDPYWYFEELVLKEVYDTPLYKAMNEQV
jgi:hypothetical protein